MIHGLELFVPCIEDEANHASRTEREAPNLWTLNFGREQSSGHRPFSEVHEQRCAATTDFNITTENTSLRHSHSR